MTKNVIYFLIAVSIGTIFLSIYAYLIDLVISTGFSIHHFGFLWDYIVYFMLYKTWILSLIFLLYSFVFYNNKEGALIRNKLAFVIFLSGFLSILFFKNEISLINEFRLIKLFFVYCLTGISLVGLQIRYWQK